MKFGFLFFLTIFILSLSIEKCYSRTYAFIVADARNGKIIKSFNSKKIVHPASLTKMMTLYLAFTEIRSGRMKLDQKTKISKNATLEPPSKFWFKTGQRVSIRFLIRAAAIRSANDAATALGEAISGSEKEFIKYMNYAAKEMGMNSTRFQNAHGLTQKNHYSTAYDMLILARRLMLDYPEYFNLFGRVETHALGKKIRNTNYKFLRSYQGASGIKTGYTNAAGHNLAASAKRGNKRLIGVLIGAQSSNDRQKKMSNLLDLSFKTVSKEVELRKLKPLSLVNKIIKKNTFRARVPLSKPNSFENILSNSEISIRKYQLQENDTVINQSLALEDVNVQIGKFNSQEKAEKNLPDMLLLNIDILSKVSNESIYIKLGDNKNNYSINIRKINYLLAQNLCSRLKTREIECVISN